MRHTNNLEQAYTMVIDKDISMTDLYIYSLIIGDDRSFGLNSKDIEDLIDKVLNSSYRSNEPLTDIVDRLLDGDYGYEGDEEYDEVWN
jgi:hypothetical protein